MPVAEHHEISMVATQRIVRMAVFASGAGSNARQIISHFHNHPLIRVAAIVCNKPNAGVIQVAESAGIPVIMIERARFFHGDGYIRELQEKKIDFIILAGFLWKIPTSVLEAFPNRIINIHPALLPDYGGKGMYGHFVHEAVIADRRSQSGITIHYVDEVYDHGRIIFQASCDILESDTPEILAEKVQQLEHHWYPVWIEKMIVSENIVKKNEQPLS